MAESTQKNQPERQLSLASILLWILSAIYTYILLFSPPKQLLPGEPIWLIQPQTLVELINESLNFFFILPISNILGFKATLAPVVHPTIEGLFNFAEAWIFMFLPLLLADKRGRKLPQVLIWILAMFLTNVFLSPYMALRAQNQLEVVEAQPNKGLLARVFGGVGLIIGMLAIIWSIIARPEFGDLGMRIQYFWQNLQENRVTIAFCVDLLLFAIFQAILLGEIEPPNSNKRWLRFIPFWGLAVWLII
ncbi:MAG TPA: hypothetical protein VK203_01460 [Nostocaceae cyanobacterium]|nr:hypothetical protein [Nostocaceae cyanobacterium]